MRRPTLVSVAIALSAATAVATAAPMTAAPATAAPTPTVQCRAGTVRPTASLTVSGTVCARFSGGQWIGSGSVRLTATRPVSGSMSWGPLHYPTRPGMNVGFKDFTVRPGAPLTVSLDGVSPAESGDTGTRWTVWIGVPNGTRAVGLEGQLASPVTTRTSTPTRASGFTGQTRWQCTTGRIRVRAHRASPTLRPADTRRRPNHRLTHLHRGPDGRRHGRDGPRR
jgi:hypothetical protein